jgi:general secretion pathway protein G
VSPAARAPNQGFTLVELLITLAIIGVLVTASIPLVEVTARRQKEADLRQALRTIRTGLDAYKAAVDRGQLTQKAGDSGYPPSLATLTEVLTRADASDPSASGVVSHIVILRRLPRDPFADPSLPAEQTWRLRSYGSRADDPQPGNDVFDVSSTSTATALDGTPYSTW